MTIDPELLTAYENADYAVFVRPELVLRIGEPSPRLDALLEQAGAASAAFLTAANPGGVRRSDADNRAAQAVLEDLVAASGYPHFPGEGRDPDGEWQPEASLLVLGIYRDNALLLGRLFQQNAIVFIEKGSAPELLFLVRPPDKGGASH